VSPPRRPLALVAGSALAFAVMALAAKLASRTLPGDQIAFLRFLLMLAPFALSPALARRALVVQRLDLLVYRGVFGGVAVLCYFLAIEHLAVGTATLLNYSSPIWAVIFASLFLGEHVEARLLVPLGLALAGLGLVTGAIGSGGGVLRLGVWELVGLASSVLSGAAVTAIRAARRTEGSWSIYGSFTVCGLVVSSPLALDGFRWPDAREWALLVVVGAASVAAQLLMTYAYRWVTNLQAGVMAQLTVVASMAAGSLGFGERLAPSQLAGAALAIAGVLGIVVLNRPPRAVE
jgi:drug/metabolite transporter (DMT)-like permease